MPGQVVLLATTLACSTACGGAPATHPASPTPTPPAPSSQLPSRGHFVADEVLVFSMSFRGFTGGTATFMTGQPGKLDGRSVIIVRSVLENHGLARLVKELRDDVTSFIDLDTGRPFQQRADSIYGDKHVNLESHLQTGSERCKELAALLAERRAQTSPPPAPATGSPARPYTTSTSAVLARCQAWPQRILVRGQRQSRSSPDRKQTIYRLLHLPPGEMAHDVHSILGMLRTWKPAPRDHITFYGMSGVSLWRIELTFTGTETVSSALGTFPALRLEGSATRLTARLGADTRHEPRTYSLWLSDDADRLPLRMAAHTELGDLAIDLVEHSRGQSRASVVGASR